MNSIRSAITPLKRLLTGAGPIIAGTFAIAATMGMLTIAPRADASQAWGSINNFDCVNDTGVECHGFEIEIDDVHSKDITYTYDWNHYSVPKITEDNTDPLHPKVFVRYQSAKNADGTWAAFTAVPSAPITPTQGHQFTNPSVNFGGEHFGVGVLGTPTAVKYNWLKDDGAGNLVFAGAVYISTPSFTYVPPAAGVPAQVQAAVVLPPPPVPPPLEFGPASWVKEIKTSSHNNKKVELRDLVSDDPNDPNFKSWRNGEPDQVEVEWRILQTSSKKPGGGAKAELVGAPEGLPNGDEVVTRRYEFYKYVGPRDAETGEAMGDLVGPDGKHGSGIVSYADYFDFALGEWHIVTTDMSKVIVVGDYSGAQMAGFDAAAKIGLIDHLQDGEINVTYADRTIVVGGTAPVVTQHTGVLPDGMAFDDVTGVLSGKPTVTGKFTFTVHSIDAAGGDIQKTFNLTILAQGEAPPPHASISTSVVPAIGGGATGDGDYAIGAAVTVLATANAGYSFANWTDGGAIVSAVPSYTFTADVNRALVANFVNGLLVSTSSSPAAGGTTSGGGTFQNGNSATVVSKANVGYAFVNWTEGGVAVSATASYTFTVTASRNLVANFSVVSRATSLSMSGANGQVGKSTTLIAALRDKLLKTGLPGKSVQFAMDGTNIGAPVTTDATGKAKLVFIIPEETPLGLRTITASFAGEPAYGASVCTSTLGVTKGAVKLTVTNVNGKAGTTVKLSAKITNTSNQPMVGEPIVLTLGGVVVGTPITDANGVASMNYAIPAGTAKGYYALVATFAEDADHFGGTKAGWLLVK